MDLGNTVFILGIIILLVIAIAIALVLQGYSGSKYGYLKKLKGKPMRKSTIILDEKEDTDKCEICYGAIDDDSIAKCPCGRVFHEACARPTGSCPYCNAPYAAMDTRGPEVTVCPICGRPLKGNICSCGAVTPSEDYTIVCGCGAVIDADKPVCKKCGAVYEFVPVSEFIGRK